ncbi:unnamed protein product [Phaeothamnion confervicola]
MAASAADDVFCHGPLLHAVQVAELFEDSKTFVDMYMLKEPAEVISAFGTLSEAQRHDKKELRRFVKFHFGDAGGDLGPAVLPDFTPDPPFLAAISDAELREWARALHGLWPALARAPTAAAVAAPQRYSLLLRRRPVVVPGGRFRESYYWDTLWVILGLLAGGMVQTATGIVENFLDDIDHFGFVPNGGRVYYVTRSQPPLLSEMVASVYGASRDVAFLRRCLPRLEREHATWMDPAWGHVVELRPPSDCRGDDNSVEGGSGGSGGNIESGGASEWSSGEQGSQRTNVAEEKRGPRDMLNRFFSTDAAPRPESYREDLATSLAAAAAATAPINDRSDAAAASDGILDSAATAAAVCGELRAAAESGWDFSIRWIADGAAGGSSGGDAKPTANSQGGGGRGGGGGSESDNTYSPGGAGPFGPFSLSATKTRSFVPADLNAILYRMEINVARMHAAVALAVDSERGKGSESGGGIGSGDASSSGSGGSSNGGSCSGSAACPHSSRGDSNDDDEAATAVAASSVPARHGTGHPLLDFVAATRPGAFDDPQIPEAARTFAAAAARRAGAMDRWLWQPEEALWRDCIVDGVEARPSPHVTAACFMPLWAGMPLRRECSKDAIDWSAISDAAGDAGSVAASSEPLRGAVTSRAAVFAAVAAAFRGSGLLCEGGVATTLARGTGQQWDHPNAWPPLQWILAEGFGMAAIADADALDGGRGTGGGGGCGGCGGSSDSSGSSGRIGGGDSNSSGGGGSCNAEESCPAAGAVARDIVRRWTAANLAGWRRTGVMFEKYDAAAPGARGGGGEYVPQEGFGWSNGVALDFMIRHYSSAAGGMAPDGASN